MIKYGLKLWSSNINLLEEAVFLYRKKYVDFIELYHDADKKVNFNSFGLLKKIPINIHAYHNKGFHEFRLGKNELEIWKITKQMADFFKSQFVIVHAGKASGIKNFVDNLKKIDDPRILIENMSGLDIYGKPTFGYNLKELKKIKKIKNICFDLEKAVKSACYQKISYKKFISQCLQELKPLYFHISGGDVNNLHDEHLNLYDANFDLKWIKTREHLQRKECVFSF